MLILRVWIIKSIYALREKRGSGCARAAFTRKEEEELLTAPKRQEERDDFLNDDDDEIELLLLLLLIARSFSFPGLKVAFTEEEMREEKTIDDIPLSVKTSLRFF